MLKRLMIAATAVAALVALAAPTYAADLSEGDVDIGIAYEDDAWDLHVHDHDNDIEYEPDEAVLQVVPEAETTVPINPNYSFLGSPGDPVWVLPQVEEEGLLALGFGLEELEAGVFLTDHVTLNLVGLSGPGQMAVYTTDPFGEPEDIYFNSGDGIGPSDFVALEAGSHSHANWAFSAPGTYEVTFEASGTLVEGNTFTSSGPVTYTVQVLSDSVGGIVSLPVAGESTGTSLASLATPLAAIIVGLAVVSGIVLFARKRSTQS